MLSPNIITDNTIIAIKTNIDIIDNIVINIALALTPSDCQSCDSLVFIYLNS